MHWTASRILQLWHSDAGEDVPLQRMMFATLFAVALSASFCILNPVGPLGLFGAPLSTLWAISLAVSGVLLLANTVHGNKPSTMPPSGASSAAHKCIHALLLALSVPVFFEGSNIVARARYAKLGNAMLFDEMLIAVDEAMFGAFFPRGQLSLWLDTNAIIGVTTAFGRFASEILQVLYVSYYLWGNGLMVYLLYRFSTAASSSHASYSSLPAPGGSGGGFDSINSLSHTTSASGSGGSAGIPDSPPADAATVAWRRMALTVSALVSTFHFNFLLNLLLPAVSPRIYLESAYVNPVQCIFLGDILRGAVTKAAARSFSAFPSGHCGLSWLTALAARRLGLRRLAPLSLAAACAITTATLTLRYHYVADALGAVLLLLWGRAVGCMWSDGEFAEAVAAAPPRALEVSAAAAGGAGIIAQTRAGAAAALLRLGFTGLAHRVAPTPVGARYALVGSAGSAGAGVGAGRAGGGSGRAGAVAADDDDTSVELDRLGPAVR